MKQFYIFIMLIFASGAISAQISMKEKMQLEKEVINNFQRTQIEGAQLYKTLSGYRVLVTTTAADNNTQARVQSQAMATEYIIGAESKSVSVYQSDASNTSTKETFSDKIIQTSLGQVNSMEPLTTFTDENGNTLYSYFLVISKTNAKKGLAGAMSMIIPGMGQFYKGNTLKGGMFLGLTVAAGTGILVCESTRSSYRNKAIEQPKYAKDYNTKADNWETYRNICIGATGAIYIWNLVDAFFAKSAQKAVAKSNKNSFTFTPTATFNNVGLSLTYNF